MFSENELLAWLGRRFASHRPDVTTAIGDDAAVLAPSAESILVATDLICEGVHFRLAECGSEAAGRKALAVNLSDMAAMAAQPRAAFVSLLLPSRMSQADVERIMRGIGELAEQFDCVVAGGDTNVWQGELAINVAVLGTASTPWLRSGAQIGDRLLVTGALGGSLSGHHLTFTPRIHEALRLHDQFQVHAAMDVSDGIATDLPRLARASGIGCEVELDRLPVSVAARQPAADDQSARMAALSDGEDFELLLAVPPQEAQRMLDRQPLDIPITDIGHCRAGDALYLVVDGVRQPWPPLGYEHRGAS